MVGRIGEAKYTVSFQSFPTFLCHLLAFVSLAEEVGDIPRLGLLAKLGYQKRGKMLTSWVPWKQHKVQQLTETPIQIDELEFWINTTNT